MQASLVIMRSLWGIGPERGQVAAFDFARVGGAEVASWRANRTCPGSIRSGRVKVTSSAGRVAQMVSSGVRSR